MRCQKRTRLSNILISYYLDGDRVLGEDWGDGNTAYTQWRYFYDLNGIAGLTYNNIAYSLIPDALGNVRFVLKNNNIIGKYSYDAYGNCIVTETANISEDERFVVNNNPWRWKGYYYDTESNLYYIRGRYYDPRIMQYIDADTPENIFSALMGVLNGLDRNAVVCNNILSLALNNCTIQTYLEMYAYITEIDKERSTWWMWVVGLAIIILLALIALGGLAVAAIGALTSNLFVTGIGCAISWVASKVLLSTIVAAAICTLAGGVCFYNNEIYWDWNGAAEGFITGVVIGAISGAVSFASNYIGIKLSKNVQMILKGVINAGVSATLELTRQLIVEGDVDMVGLVIASSSGFFSGLSGACSKIKPIQAFILSTFIEIAFASIGELIELSKSNYGLPMMPQASMQYSY